MSKYRKLETLTAMKETGIVPVFFNNNVEIAQNVVKACYEGGIRAFEFTNRGDFAIEVFKELSKFVLAECPGLILGAGTILDTPTAALYIQMGANFIVSPSLNPEVARLCNRHGIPYTPGCGSVTEICNAQELGCDLVKVFPAGSVGGPKFVREEHQSSDALVYDHGHRKCGADRGESLGLGQIRSHMRRDGL